jgi:hypothetical protein
MKNIRIAIQVQKKVDSEGNETFKASVPMRLVFEKDFDVEWLNTELKKFEQEYTDLVTSLKNILKQIKSTRGKGKVLMYWKLGDEIVNFMEYNERGALFLENMMRHFVRDTGVSVSTLERCKKFRLFYPDISTIDPDRSFNSYVSLFESGYVSGKRK